MRKGEIRLGNIEADMLKSVFTDRPGCSTLGSEFGVPTIPEAEPTSLPVGSKVFVMSSVPEKQSDPSYDSVGMILGHANGGNVNILTLSPKNGDRWGTHIAYGYRVSEVPDALASLDRLFDPVNEFGSVAVLSEATGDLLKARTSATVGDAGCHSHEKEQLSNTLTLSQLLDTYRWEAISLLPNSRLLRRDENSRLIHLAPGQQHKDQPTREMRDQRGMLDRIQGLVLPGSELSGVTPVAVLRGIESAVSSGVFTDRSAPISEVSRTIKTGAEKVVA